MFKTIRAYMHVMFLSVQTTKIIHNNEKYIFSFCIMFHYVNDERMHQCTYLNAKKSNEETGNYEHTCSWSRFVEEGVKIFDVGV